MQEKLIFCHFWGFICDVDIYCTLFCDFWLVFVQLLLTKSLSFIALLPISTHDSFPDVFMWPFVYVVVVRLFSIFLANFCSLCKPSKIIQIVWERQFDYKLQILTKTDVTFKYLLNIGTTSKFCFCIISNTKLHQNIGAPMCKTNLAKKTNNICMFQVEIEAKTIIRATSRIKALLNFLSMMLSATTKCSDTPENVEHKEQVACTVHADSNSLNHQGSNWH